MYPFARFLLGVVVFLFVGRETCAVEAPAFALEQGDRVVFLGDTLIEREQQHGWLELVLTARFPDRGVTFRNLGWSADTSAGESRFGLSLLQAGREPADEGWKQLVKQLEGIRPTVVFVGYGMASSFAGESGLAQFVADYRRLLDTLARISPTARLVLLTPIAHETLGGAWPKPDAHNAQLAPYVAAVRDLATERKARFVSLFEPRLGSAPLTDNGIHLHERGYRALAERVEEQLFGAAGAWRSSERLEPLRRAIVQKNEWFFHRSRPANMAYIFGFRKKEQGHNAIEVTKFDELIAAEEKRIAQLRFLQPVSLPEIPRRAGNATATLAPQPHPKFQAADGIEVTLWAENPLLHKPVQMNFDARGRLWVASSELYPQIEPGQAATDRIIVLEDTTGSGRADKATVFAEGLLIPTGLEIGDGGAYVAQSTELLHFRDTNGDGKADVRRTVLSGFGTEDTHHNLHTLRWAPDGRLAMNQAVYTRSDIETPHGVVRLKAGGVYRFDPRDQQLEIMYRGWVNPWGHQFDELGNSFVTDGAGMQGISWGVRGATYFTLAPHRRVLQSVSPGNYPKFCGLEIVRSTHFPDEWQGDLITADFRAHRVVRFKLAEQGAGFVTQEMPDVLRTTTDSFRPIDVRLGPDGALYVADWSNPIIQHGEVDFRDPRRDKVHGRIWRIAMKGRPVEPRVDLTRLANRDLLARLNSRNGYEREQAKRVLVERGAEAVRQDVAAWAGTLSTEREKLQALWLQRALNLPPIDLLDAKDGGVRAAAIRALRAETSLARLEKLVVDEHPRVRLEAVRALGEMGARQEPVRCAELALSVLDRPTDPFLDYALWLTVNDLAQPWVEAVKRGTWKIAGRERQLEFGLKAIEPQLASGVLRELIAAQGIPRDGSGPWIELIGAAGGPTELRALMDAVVRRSLVEPAAVRALRALADAARLRGVVPEGDLAGFGALLETESATVRLAAIPLTGTWRLSAHVPQLVASASQSASAAERSAAFTALRNLAGPAVVSELKGLMARAGSPEVRREAVLTLAALDFAAVQSEVIALLKNAPDEGTADGLWRTVLAIRGAAGRLARELPAANLPPHVARAGLRPAREGTQNSALVQELQTIAGLTSSVQLSAAELQAIAQEALAKGDAHRGEMIYRQPDLACAPCHAIGGAGGKLGPDLTSIGASAPADYLLEALLYPNAKIKEGYHSVSVTTKDNREVTGMIVRETERELVLRNAANEEVSLATSNIARRANVDSLMPPGLIDRLLPEERLDLLKFLSQLGKPGEFDAAQGGVARAWRLYLVTSTNQHLGVERVVRGDSTLGDWQPVLSLVNGTLPRPAIEAALPLPGNTRGLFAATRVQASRAGPVKLRINGDVTGVWVNGSELVPAAEISAQVTGGMNLIVLRLDETKLTTPLALRSTDVTFVHHDGSEGH